MLISAMVKLLGVRKLGHRHRIGIRAAHNLREQKEFQHPNQNRKNSRVCHINHELAQEKNRPTTRRWLLRCCLTASDRQWTVADGDCRRHVLTQALGSCRNRKMCGDRSPCP
ncbi:hypothetical protein BS78_05G018700 [Paspalum vaginatum]|nr:hypothetical protein BS78_05G018700 [Paspalum vaginatum]